MGGVCARAVDRCGSLIWRINIDAHAGSRGSLYALSSTITIDMRTLFWL